MNEDYKGFYSTCYKCKERKLKTGFVKDNTRKEGIRGYCKDCDNARYLYSQESTKLSTRQRNQRFLIDYLENNPCVNCGNTDIRVLEFNHIKPGKRNEVGKMVTSCYSLSNIAEEIAKCEVLCANCHRIYTMSESNHYRHVYLESKKLSEDT